LFIFGLVALPAFAATDPAPATVQESPLDRAVLDIAKDLRCAVCQNQPVSESNADLAQDMRRLIREQLIVGKSRDEIVDYFVARYGDYVLMKPPAAGEGLPIWLAPPLLLAGLAFLGWRFLRRRTHQPPSPSPVLSEEDRARVRAIRDQQES
jgi:cytochrome c-type biogenesis protein CcmH